MHRGTAPRLRRATSIQGSRAARHPRNRRAGALPRLDQQRDRPDGGVTRRVIAIVIIAVWGMGLALLYNRNNNRTPEQALAEAGMRVSPATYYYILEQGGQQVGAASSALDTT